MIKLIAVVMATKKIIKSEVVQNIINDKENQEMVARIVKRTLKKLGK